MEINSLPFRDSLHWQESKCNNTANGNKNTKVEKRDRREWEAHATVTPREAHRVSDWLRFGPSALLRSQLRRPLLLAVGPVGTDLHQGAGEAAPVVRVGGGQLEGAAQEHRWVASGTGWLFGCRTTVTACCHSRDSPLKMLRRQFYSWCQGGYVCLFISTITQKLEEGFPQNGSGRNPPDFGLDLVQGKNPGFFLLKMQDFIQHPLRFPENDLWMLITKLIKNIWVYSICGRSK